MQTKSKSLFLVFMMTSVLVTTVGIFSMPTEQVYASTNTIDDFGQSTGTGTENTNPDETGTGTENTNPDETGTGTENTNPDETGTGTENTNPDETGTGTENTNPDETGTGTETGTNKPLANPGLNQLVNPTAFNYQSNPSSPTVDIAKDPNQKINSIVTNSFGQGVPNIAIDVKVTTPFTPGPGKSPPLDKTISGKTDNDGKSVITVPITTTGKYSALVTIKSSAGVGGPFTDTITWEAIKSAAPATFKTSFNLARTTVDLSDDPRQQILTTVKDIADKGVKDVPLTIKLTNADGISKTFSRITDANGVDEFVTPIDKEGKWSATVTVIGPDGKPLEPVSLTWKAIP